MPMADYQCEACGFRFEHFFHSPPDTLTCEAEDPCPGTAERMASVPGEWQPRSAQAFEPVVIHRDKHGNIRFPGSANAKVPEGFMKVELRTSREVHAFEREVNMRDHSEFERSQEHHQRAFEQKEQRNRSALRADMARMSNYGKDFARCAIEQNNNRPRKRFFPGFHIEAFHHDSSNRDAPRSERTGWRPERK